MNDVLWTVLALSLVGSAFICALLVTDGLFLKRGPKRFLYYAWVLVLLRLLLPFHVEPYEVPMPAVLAQSDTASATHSPIDTPMYEVLADGSIDTAMVQAPQVAVPNHSDAPTTSSTTSASTRTLRWLLANPWCIWASIAAGMFLFKVFRYRRFTKGVQAAAVPCDDIELLDKVAQLGEKMGVRRPVELCINANVASPMLVGHFNPWIVLPTTDLAPDELEYILLHELSHLRRWDSVYKWIVQITVCVHWFNPLVYVMSRHINRSCELACDEDVLRLAGSEPRGYGKTLLRAMATGGPLAGAAGSVELGENKQLLEERMTIMMRGKRSIFASILSVLLVACLFMSAGCVRIHVPISAAPRYSADEQSAPAKEVAATGSTLELSAAQCGVLVELTNADEITAAYDEDYVSVDIIESADTTQVSCVGLEDASSRFGEEYRVILEVPKSGFGNIRLTNSQGFMGWYELPSANITGAFSEGAAVLTMPSDFHGSVDVSSTQGLLVLASQNGFANCDIEAQNTDGLLTGPAAFTREGNTAHYATGTGENRIYVSGTEGYVCLNDSDSLAQMIMEAARTDFANMHSLTKRILNKVLTSGSDQTADSSDADSCVDSIEQDIGVSNPDTRANMSTGTNEYENRAQTWTEQFADKMENAGEETALQIETSAECFASRLQDGIDQLQMALDGWSG